MAKAAKHKSARIESLEVRNYRALRQVKLEGLTPLTVLLGPNGSGKSTVFDVFAFMSQCFAESLRKAWDKRGRGKEIKSREGDGPVVIEIKYREAKDEPLITYHLEIDENRGAPEVVAEWLRWKRGSHGAPYKFLDYSRGKGQATTGEQPDAADKRIDIPLKSPDLLAVSALGQFAEHPRVAALRDFVIGWHVSYLSAEGARGTPDTGPQERLSRTGDNLANVIQHLAENHPGRLDEVYVALRQRVPRIDKVLAEPMEDGRLLLRIKDAPFAEPVLSRYASDGTLKLLAYLVLLHDPDLPPFLGIEEPENFLHPRLLFGLAEECRAASERAQLLVTTHSPHFLDGIRAEESWLLWRDEKGYTQAKRAADLPGLPALIDAGASLGELWMEGHFGDPSRGGVPEA